MTPGIDLLDLDRFQRLEHHDMFKRLRAELGFSQAHGSLINVSKPGQLDLLAEKVIPAVEKF